ncbi:MAG: Ig-like domain-containing protein [Clostridia bacterium]|nr:Ig-like domain-containing protein [Clostridia bacterium]
MEPTSVSFAEGNITIEIGNSPTVLSASIEPSNANSKTKITYRVVDESIATIDSQTGELHAVSAGTTVVIATTENGKEARMTINVKNGAEADMGGMELINGNVKYWRYIPHIEDIGTYKNIPLIVYLHGGNGKETNPNSFDAIGYSLPKYLKDGTLKANSIIVSPVSYSTSAVLTLINDIKSQYDIDESNISITGHSTGAYNAFNIAANNQDVFKTCVPVSLRYAGSYSKIKSITKCDLRFIFESNFAGSPKSEQEMKNIKKEVDRLNNAGVSNIIRYETIPGTGHNEVVSCYNEELIEWMIGSNRGKIAKKSNQATNNTTKETTKKVANPTITTTGRFKEAESKNGFNKIVQTTVTKADKKTATMKLGLKKASTETNTLVVFLHGSGDSYTSTAVDRNNNPFKSGEYTADIIVVQIPHPSGGSVYTKVYSDDTTNALYDGIKEYINAGYKIHIIAWSMGGYGAIRLANKILTQADNQVLMVSLDATPNFGGLNKSEQTYYKTAWLGALKYETKYKMMSYVHTPGQDKYGNYNVFSKFNKDLLAAHQNGKYPNLINVIFLDDCLHNQVIDKSGIEKIYRVGSTMPKWAT